MTIIQSEACSIVTETETPEIEVRIEEVDSNNLDTNNTELEVLHNHDREHRISVVSDTDYNASAESNNSSRRSSIDVPQFDCSLTLNRNHRGGTNCCDGGQSEVGRLCELSALTLPIYLVFVHLFMVYLVDFCEMFECYCICCIAPLHGALCLRILLAYPTTTMCVLHSNYW